MLQLTWRNWLRGWREFKTAKNVRPSLLIHSSISLCIVFCFFLIQRLILFCSHLVKDPDFFLFLSFRANGVFRSPFPSVIESRGLWEHSGSGQRIAAFVSAWAASPRVAELGSHCLLRNIHQKYLLWKVNKQGLQARGSVSREFTVRA